MEDAAMTREQQVAIAKQIRAEFPLLDDVSYSLMVAQACGVDFDEAISVEKVAAEKPILH